MMKFFLLYILFFILFLNSCVQKDLDTTSNSVGRFNGDTVKLSYNSTKNLLNIGTTVSISPIILSGKIKSCGIKFGTQSLPAGLTINNSCQITGTPALLTSEYTYTISAVSEYNTTAEATVRIVVGTFYNLGGNVTGLNSGETVTISNGIDTTLVTSNTSFSMTPVSSGNTYSLTLTPSDSSRFTCTFPNNDSSGTINMHVNNIAVQCASSGNRTLVGTLSGMRSIDGNVVLQNNGSNAISKTASGTFDFGSYAVNSSYNITVSSMPPGYTCSVGNGSGTLSDNISNVSIVCTPPSPKTITVKVLGLNSGSFNIQNLMTKDDATSYTDSMTISSNGLYTFSQTSKYNTTYSVTKLTNPAEHSCSITNGSGTALADVADIVINCTANQYSVSGSISGLTSGDSIKFYFNDINGPTEITHSYDTDGSTFTLPRNFEYNRQYRIVLSEAPTGKKCYFGANSSSTQGFISGNSTGNNITCEARETAACEFGLPNYTYPGGQVNDMVCDGSYLYVGGSFKGQVNQNGSLNELNSSTLLSDYKQSFKIEGGSVSSIVDDGEVGYYIGGSFTSVNGVARAGLAHLYYDGSLDPNFAPTVNNRIRKIIIYKNYLYIGGDFTAVSSTSRGYFAKVHRHTGLLQSLNISFNNYIYDMVLRDTKLMIGGIFTTVNSSLVRSCLAELDLTTESISSFVPSFSGSCYVYTMEKDSSNNLYVGGNFTNAMSEVNLNNLFKITSTNILDTINFNSTNAPNNAVYKLKMVTESSTEKLMIGGGFSSIFGTSSTYLAKINIQSVTKEAINNSNSNIFSIEEDTNNLYTIDYSGYISKYAKGAATATTTMALDAIYNQLGSTLRNVNGKLILSNVYNSYIYSSFSSNISYLYRYNLNTGRVDSSFNLGLNGSVGTLVKSGNNLYIGGSYTNILSQSAKKYLTKIDISSTPTLSSTFTSTLNGSVSKIILNGSELITLGGFITVDGVSRKYLVSLDPSTGLYRSTVDSTTYTAAPRGIETDGTNLYILNNAGTDLRKYVIGYPFTYDSTFSTGTSQNLYYMTYKSGYLYLTGTSNYITYNGVATSKFLIRVDSSTGIRDSAFLPTSGYTYGIPFIDQSLTYLYTPSYYTMVKQNYSNGASNTYVIAPALGTSNYLQAFKYIEGTDFYIMGGNFNSGSLVPNNLIFLKKSY